MINLSKLNFIIKIAFPNTYNIISETKYYIWIFIIILSIFDFIIY